MKNSRLKKVTSVVLTQKARGRGRAGIRFGVCRRDQSRHDFVRAAGRTRAGTRTIRELIGLDVGQFLGDLRLQLVLVQRRRWDSYRRLVAIRLGRLALERLVDSGVEVHTVKVTVGRTTGLTVILPYPEHRFILTYPGTMYELAYEDIDLDYVCSARHFHMSSFFLHRGLRSHMLAVFRLSKLRAYDLARHQ